MPATSISCRTTSIDCQYCPATTEGIDGDPHPVVKILTIDLTSH
jgi:hypothetical protein